MVSKELDITHLDEVLELLKSSRFLERNWMILGLNLGLIKDTLDTIEARHGTDVTRCLLECLSNWLRRVDKVDERGGSTWKTLAGALKKIGETTSARNAKRNAEKEPELSITACQMLQRHTDSLILPAKIVRILHTERLISKETLDEVIRMEGVLGDGALRALCTTVSVDPNKLRIFASVLLKSEETVAIGNNILKQYNKTFQIMMQPHYIYDFDQMRVAYGKLKEKVVPIVVKSVKSISSLRTLKKFIQRCFPELTHQLAIAKSFNNIMELVEDKCTIINVACLEAIVDHYNIIEAKKHIEDFKKLVDDFCEKIKADICCNQSFKVDSFSHPLICETIVFVLEWEADKHTIGDIKRLLAKAFKDLVNNVQVRAINEGESIIVTCYAPQHMMDILLMTAKESLDQLKEIGLSRLSFGYYTIFDTHEIKAMIKEKTKELTVQLELQQTISKKKTMEIKSLEGSQTKLRVEVGDLQKIITNLTLQLEESTNTIKKKNDVLSKIKKHSQEHAEKSFTELINNLTSSANVTESKDEDTTNVKWYSDVVELTLPTSKQSEDVMSKLKEEQQMEWSIWVYKSSPESLLVIINNLNECPVKGLILNDTPLDSNCITVLSGTLARNKKLKTLELHSSSLTGSIKQVTDALSNNDTLETFGMWNVKLAITDNDEDEDDASHLSYMLRTNNVLKELHLHNSNINDKCVQQISEGIIEKQTLTRLDISYNPMITSESTTTFAELLQETTLLAELHLNHTALTSNNFLTIFSALVNNSTIQRLWLSRAHKESCENFDDYETIKQRLAFW